MKINKNVVLEYLYLTIFVITLFVLKELIEYVFFTRKRNNIIEKFSNTAACDKISWYYENHANIKKIFEIFDGLRTSGSTTLGNAKMRVDDYVEFKHEDETTKQYSRIILLPKESAICFERFIGDRDQTPLSPPSSLTSQECYAIIFRSVSSDGTIVSNSDSDITNSKKVLDFVSYSYDYNQFQKASDGTPSENVAPEGKFNDAKVFARFDTEANYQNIHINVETAEMMKSHE